MTTLAAPSTKPLRATIRYPGRNIGPAWSFDGKLLAFLSRTGTENFGEASRAITVRSMESDDERQVTPKLAHIERVRWSPDGQSVLVSGSDGKGRAGLFRVDVRTSAVRPIAWKTGGGFRGFPGLWSTADNTVYYIYEESEVREHDVATGKERTLWRGEDLRHIALAPTGRKLAVGSGNTIRLISLARSDDREIAFES